MFVLAVAAAVAGDRAGASPARHPAPAPPSSSPSPSPSPSPAETSAARGAGASTLGEAEGPADVPVIDLAAIRRKMRKARGRVLLVHFWASWCGPCLEELPLVDRFAREARARGVDVLSISLDQERAAGRVAEVLAARAPSLTALIARIDDPDLFVLGFGGGWEGSIPALFAFDRRGQMSGSRIGEVSRADLDNLVAEAQRGRARPSRDRP